MRTITTFVLVLTASAVLIQTRTPRSTAMRSPSALSAPAARAVVGTATYYAEDYEGLPMASGDSFDPADATVAAANGWPLGTRLRVRRAPGSPWDETLSPAERDAYYGRSIVVTVLDRGAFSNEVDLSRAAFERLGRRDEGVIRVVIETLE